MYRPCAEVAGCGDGSVTRASSVRSAGVSRERRNADLFLAELMEGGRIRSSLSMLGPLSEPTLEDAGPRPRRDDTGYWFVDMKGFLGGAFAPSHPLWMPDPRPGNEVKILLNGQETYREMIKALEPYPKKWGPDSFIYLSNWIVYDDFNLDRDPQFRLVSTPRTTLRDCLRRASDNNVLIRALFWDRVIKSGSTHQNDGPRDFINSLRTGHAILDGRVINSVIGDTYDKGSHHQKLLLVNGPEGLLAFAGGVDFHPNRVFQHGDPLDAPPGTGSPVKRLDDKSAPLLDVHVRIRGPAAYDLLDVFLRRYADHPTAANHEIYAPYRDYKPLPSGRVTMRVCTTFGDKPIRDDTNVSPTQKTLQLLEGPQTERPYRQTNVVTIKQDGGGRLRGSSRILLLHAAASLGGRNYLRDLVRPQVHLLRGPVHGRTGDRRGDPRRGQCPRRQGHRSDPASVDQQ